MERITKKDIKSATGRFTDNARICGLLENGERIHYNAGSVQGGVSAVLSIIKSVPWNERNAYWLPRFSPKDSLRTQYKAIEAASDALRAMCDIVHPPKSVSATDEESDTLMNVTTMDLVTQYASYRVAVAMDADPSDEVMADLEKVRAELGKRLSSQ